MKPILFYLLQVIAASGLLYAYYHFALRNKKFHRYNRFYLLMTIVVSSLIPFLNIPVYFSGKATESSVVLQTLQAISSSSAGEYTTYIDANAPAKATSFVTTENLLYMLYSFMILFLLARIFISVIRIRSIIRRNTVEQIDKIKFINTDEPGTPFSFFRWLFWNRKIDLDSEKGEQIFRHELFHIQQKHSWDIIATELVSALFWINPFFHLIKRELKAIHEFLADEFAIHENRNWQYAELLLMQAFNTSNRLVNPFFHNQIKRRIAMITTSTKPSYQYLRKLMVLPVIAVIFMLCAFKYGKNDQVESGGSIKLSDPKEVFFADTNKTDLQKNLMLKKSLIIIDGIKQTKRGLSSIDSALILGNKIETISLFTDKLAIEGYGEEGKDGVVEIVTRLKAATLPKSIYRSNPDSAIWIKHITVPTQDKDITADKLKLWENEKEYIVWLDDSRVPNKTLGNYAPADFEWYHIKEIDQSGGNSQLYRLSIYTKRFNDSLAGRIGKGPQTITWKTKILDTLKPKQPQPLWVIDGKLIPNLAINDIAPNDIESITVLKNQKAIDKYGEAAKNGVIEIITKNLGPVVRDNVTSEKVIVDSAIVVMGKPLPDNKVFVRPEIEAAFPGGVKAWRKFLTENLKSTVPVDSGAKAGTYTVVLQFLVDKEGNVSDIRTLTNYKFGMERECIRVMKLSPKWDPAIQNGHPVNAYRKQPITFVIADEKDEPVKEIKVTGFRRLSKTNGPQPASKPGEVKEIVVTGHKLAPGRKEPDQLAPIYPNPATNNITIPYNAGAEGKVQVRVYDLMSNLTMETKVNLTKGKNNINVSVASLAAGTYMINIADAAGNILAAYKMIKK